MLNENDTNVESIAGMPHPTIVHKWNRNNNAGGGIDGTNIVETGVHLGTVGKGSDRIDVYKTHDGMIWGVANANGPWAVQLKQGAPILFGESNE